METADATDDLRRALHDGESLQWVVRPNRTALFASRIGRSVVGGLVLGFFLTIPGIIAGLFAKDATGIDVLVYAVPAGLFLTPTALLLLYNAVSMAFVRREYAATDERLIEYTGVFGRSLDSVPVDGVQDAEFDVGFVGNALGVGTVTVDTDRGVEPMRFEAASDPQALSTEVAALVSDRGGSAGTREGDQSVAEQA
jgi:uncharacterized membrane protein YdbT with pleckstrin-like domain